MSIATLFPEPKIIKISEHEFMIREFHVKEFPTVIKIASKMTGANNEDIMQAVDLNMEMVLKMVSGVTGQPVEVIEKMRMPVLLHIIEKIVEENIDFFFLELPKAIQRMTKHLTTAGSAQSNS